MVRNVNEFILGLLLRNTDFLGDSLFVHVQSSLGYVYLPNNLLCAATSPRMPCITHVFTMINIRGEISKECSFYWSRFLFCFRRNIVKLHRLCLAAAGGKLSTRHKRDKHYARLYKEASFAFVNHSASKSQGWVVQI